jgi:hypothetical protein
LVCLFDTLQKRSISMSTRLVIITVATSAALVSPALAAGSGHHHKKMSVHSTRAVNPRAFGNARGEAGGGFRGYPTDYLYQRFGDFQAQGEL